MVEHAVLVGIVSRGPYCGAAASSNAAKAKCKFTLFMLKRPVTSKGCVHPVENNV